MTTPRKLVLLRNRVEKLAREIRDAKRLQPETDAAKSTLSLWIADREALVTRLKHQVETFRDFK